MEPGVPKDTKNIVYIIILVHGLGVLISWNMFITAKDYFVKYKLKNVAEYAQNYLVYVGWAAQIPNLVFNWLNVFVTIGGNFSQRILISLILEAVIFIITVILAILDSTTWPGAFFWITMICVFCLNSLNAIYQNSIYGKVCNLPPKYFGAIVLGNNIAGTLVVFVSWATSGFENYRTAAIYYFIFGAFMMLVCFDTFLALPLNSYYRYYTTGKHQTKSLEKLRIVPYREIFRKASVQLYNIFLTFFVSLTAFPAIISDIKPITKDFLGKNFVLVTCFLTFNVMAMFGSLTASLRQWPGSRVLSAYTTARLIFIPFFILCNYQVPGRTWPVIVQSDWVFWLGSAVMAFTSGHASSLSFMYLGGTVSPEHASTVGMIGAAMLITGIITGITFGLLGPVIVSL